ncbi:amino acid ABC transporter permease [Actinoallomurus purpureus]|uniref:amino acid ABC transporter permease n=1 Tax=Actinoallomurus purpureus TaxID=478114 RepID=UPI00209388AF|nr:amino acid ABC transporter permease [Actinoallomurus purpureus]MCO6006387.1 amino acid ABC transporter permease [Actinoallomurus purpureus]
MSTVTETKPAPRRAEKPQASVLFDAPGPKARLRHNILTLVAAVAILGIVYVVLARLDKEGQLDGKLWKPFLKGSTWTDFILPGIGGTLKAAFAGAVLALLFGVLFGLGRLSEHRWIRVPAAAVVEFFRAIPLLILIFFVFSGPATIATALNREFPEVSAFAALVIALMLYNGSVLAEIFRAGINSVPRGQSEAAYVIGLRKSGVMRLILIPQATTAMMPAIVSQLVVLLKDSALGWIIGYEDLLNTGYRLIPAQYSNLIPAAIVIALIYIAMNLAISYLATWLEKRSRRSRKTSAKTLGTGLSGEVIPAP